MDIPPVRDEQRIGIRQIIHPLLPPTANLLVHLGIRYTRENVKFFIHDLHSTRESLRTFGKVGLAGTVLVLAGVLYFDERDLRYTKNLFALVGFIALTQHIGATLKYLSDNEQLGIFAGTICAMVVVGILFSVCRRNS